VEDIKLIELRKRRYGNQYANKQTNKQGVS